MNERSGVWRVAAELLRTGERAAMATVARRRGSLPMASDAKMIVTPDGRRWGTVGGGCMEADVTAQALETLTAGTPAVVRHTLNADVAGDLGLSCGGTAEMFLEPLTPSPDLIGLLQLVADAAEDRRSAVVLTAVRWSSGPRKAARIGDDVQVVGDWSPPEPLGTGAASVDETTGTFIEPVPRAPRLIVFGAGHVGRAIEQAASLTDFHVMVIDDRAEFANTDRLRYAEEVVVGDMRAVADELTVDEDDYVIVATRGHRQDALIVERVAASRARYVGMLGSRRKQAVIWKALAAAGVPEESLARVRVPIGLEIGADTPGEIGVAVLAELIRVRRSAAQQGEQRPK